MQAYNSIRCGCFCIGYVDFMLKGRSLLDYKFFFLVTNLNKMIK